MFDQQFACAEQAEFLERFSTAKKNLAELEAVPIFVTGKSMIWKVYNYLQNPKLCNVNFGRKTKKPTILQLDLLGYGVILPLLFGQGLGRWPILQGVMGPYKMAENYIGN